jgi:putative N6-adenine-specific DNA methylase
MGQTSLELFASTQPGLELILAEELQGMGFHQALPVEGGVEFQSDMAGLMRANLCCRVASRILVRVHSFKAGNLGQLLKRARKFPWNDWIPEGLPIQIKASCKRSRIYHSGAVEERIRMAFSDAIGSPLLKPKVVDSSGVPKETHLAFQIRVNGNSCTISLDSSGELLHRRGYRLENAKAPLRENIASAFLMLSGWTNPAQAEALGGFVDPMCGSGTLAIEAAQIAMGIPPGLNRSFAFEHFKNFDEQQYKAVRFNEENRILEECPAPIICSDRDEGAIAISGRNAERAKVSGAIETIHQSLSALRPPSEAGLWLSNPPYGVRVRSSDPLKNLYATIGRTYREHFDGWSIGLITNDLNLARHSGLNFKETSAIIPHGGLKIRLYFRS